MLEVTGMEELSNVTTVGSNDTVYLSQLNLKYGIVVSDQTYNITQIYPILSNLTMIYSNGNCEIYENAG